MVARGGKGRSSCKVGGHTARVSAGPLSPPLDLGPCAYGGPGTSRSRRKPLRDCAHPAGNNHPRAVSAGKAALHHTRGHRWQGRKTMAALGGMQGWEDAFAAP